MTDKAIEKKIPLVEMFGPTIQGEGNVIGQQTYFLRFGLCDYKCTMCDSLHAVMPALVKANAQWITQQEIFDQFVQMRNPNSTRWLTFSGGNPAIHDLTYLVGLCKLKGMLVNVETQGTKYAGWLNKVDNLTISPKGPGMGEKHDNDVFKGFLDKVHENGQFLNTAISAWFGPKLCIKVVIFDQRDLDFAREIYDTVKSHPLFEDRDPSDYFYLSLGNMLPPDPSGASNPDNYPSDAEHHQELLNAYRTLTEDIMFDPILSQMRFLPQWHVFVWGNGQGH